MSDEKTVREELLALLQGGNAHMSFEEAVAEFPPDFINAKPPQTPYSFWHFVEHLRIAQWDILEFIRNPKHVSPRYPEGYRPTPDQTTDESGWRTSCQSFMADLEALQEIVRTGDLLSPLPHASAYTICREILLAADHNAYHIGELAIMRQVMGIWPENNRYLTGRPD